MSLYLEILNTKMKYIFRMAAYVTIACVYSSGHPIIKNLLLKRRPNATQSSSTSQERWEEGLRSKGKEGEQKKFLDYLNMKVMLDTSMYF